MQWVNTSLFRQDMGQVFCQGMEQQQVAESAWFKISNKDLHVAEEGTEQLGLATEDCWDDYHWSADGRLAFVRL